jgi:hypothetical protein
MGANGASGLLFCSAKRTGAFPPGMLAGLRARESSLGGFTRPFSGKKFPKAGAWLFFISGEAFTSRSSSSPILMELWSEN